MARLCNPRPCLGRPGSGGVSAFSLRGPLSSRGILYSSTGCGQGPLLQGGPETSRDLLQVTEQVTGAARLEPDALALTQGLARALTGLNAVVFLQVGKPPGNSQGKLNLGGAQRCSEVTVASPRGKPPKLSPLETSPREVLNVG